MSPRMLHITCAAHALHRVAEDCRLMFPVVDELVGNRKKIFPESSARITLFWELAPGIPLPPRPVLYRWDTWLNAAVYYAAHYDAFSDVVNALDPKEAPSIVLAQRLLKKKVP